MISFPGKKSRNNDSGITSVDDENGNTDTDSDDFCPSLDPEATAALARAITDSEDESGGTPSLYTPMLSKEPSFSDGMFLKGLHRFLSIILSSTYFLYPYLDQGHMSFCHHLVSGIVSFFIF